MLFKFSSKTHQKSIEYFKLFHFGISKIDKSNKVGTQNRFIEKTVCIMFCEMSGQYPGDFSFI